MLSIASEFLFVGCGIKWKINFLSFLFFFVVQQRYVVVALMFTSLTITMALRISFPIALTQMVYIPNADDSKSVANNEIICPVQLSLLENSSEPSQAPSQQVNICLFKKLN